ncbi:MAG TPA: HAD hydrolase-like protein, partial [Chitinophagales bacterium]|nr:HAD hydrolase-like protein [Chitinophagales bacterium]
MAIKLVVFDMAGTTVEDKDNVHEALITGFKKNNFEINRADANSVMGIPKPVAIRTLLENKFHYKGNTGEMVSTIHKSFVAEMINFYKTDPSVKSKKNAEETFKQLREKGIKVCVDTGFSRDITDTIIERLQWKANNLIDLSITSDEVTNGRPYPDMILKAMNDLHITKPEEVAKVGDTIFDLQEGNGAKCRYVIGITTGAYKRAELEKEEHTHLI